MNHARVVPPRPELTKVAHPRTLPAPVEPLMTLPQVADLLGVSHTWLYERTRRNRIPCIRLGRYLRFRRSDIDAWLASGEAAVDPSITTPSHRRGLGVK